MEEEDEEEAQEAQEAQGAQEGQVLRVRQDPQEAPRQVLANLEVVEVAAALEGHGIQALQGKNDRYLKQISFVD